jgi:hypothetical protein
MTIEDKGKISLKRPQTPDDMFALSLIGCVRGE